MKPTNNDILPEGYKITELGPLPEEWEVVRVLDYCNFDRGTEPGSESYNREGEGVIFIRVGNISAGLQELLYTKSDNIKLCNEEDILMSFDGSPGIVTKGFKGAYSSGIRKVTPKTLNLDKNFLFYILKTKFVQDVIEKYKTGITIKHASKSIQHIKIPLPPLPEQQKIAAVLTAVQEAKEKTQAVIDATKALKKSMMKYLFTYGPVWPEEAANVPLKETEIGKVPEDWEVVRLREVTEKAKQKDPRRDPSNEFKYVDVSAISNDALKITSYSEFLGKNAPHRARKAIQTDDIIFATVRPYLKRIAIVPENLNGQIASTAFCVIRCKKQIVNPYYIFYTVSLDNFVNRVTENQRGSSYPAVTDKDILNQYIPLPPLPIQQKIASILSAIDAKIEAEENKKQALEELFKTLLHNLMTAKIRVTAINELP